MNDLSDQQLLRDYAQRKVESAFAELVRRHIDFVYSAALRMVRDPHLAEDVTQNVFVALAGNALKLSAHPVLAGWLHRTTQNISANAVRSETRRRNREAEAVAMNELFSQPLWHEIAPQLDSALEQLGDADREALLLRYFQRKSAQEIGAILGVSDEAAQKRVSRAVERLRQIFSSSGVTIGTTGLAALLSSHAVQAAPGGLALAITSATALAASTTTVTQAIAMTTLQKAVVATTVVAALCTALYQHQDARQLRRQNQLLVQRQTGLPARLALLESERQDITNRLAALTAENQLLKANQNTGEVLKLRGELARLQARHSSMPKTGIDLEDPALQRFLEFKSQATEIARLLEQMPDKKIPELSLLADEDWLTAVKSGKIDTEENIRKTFSTLRSLAKNRLPLGGALYDYTAQNNGQLPGNISDLKPYLKTALERAYDQSKNPSSPPPDDPQLDAILARYKLLHTGLLKDVPTEAWIIAEIAPVDKDYDSRAKFVPGGSTMIGTGKNSAGDPDDKSY